MTTLNFQYENTVWAIIISLGDTKPAYPDYLYYTTLQLHVLPYLGFPLPILICISRLTRSAQYSAQHRPTRERLYSDWKKNIYVF